MHQPFQALEVILLSLLCQCCLRELTEVLQDLFPVPDEFQGWGLWVHVVQETSNVVNLKKSMLNYLLLTEYFFYLDSQKFLINTECFMVVLTSCL